MTHLGGYLHDYNLEKRVAELDWLWDTIRESEDSENASVIMAHRYAY